MVDKKVAERQFFAPVMVSDTAAALLGTVTAKKAPQQDVYLIKLEQF